MLHELFKSNVSRGALTVLIAGAAALVMAACGSSSIEQTQVAATTVAPVSTTAPVSLPTATPDPVPLPTALPESAATAVPTSTAVPTAVPTSTLAPVPSPTADESLPTPTPTPTAAPTPTVEIEAIETPSPIPTPTVDESAAENEASPASAESDSDPTPTPVALTPTAVVATAGEPPLECYDAQVRVYRGYVDGVDSLSFEGGRVSCAGAGTNAVAAAASYRHSSGLVISRNADYIFNDAGTAYIPYSGFVHFCRNGQPASASIRADTVPALLVVIDNEAQRQLAQGASAPLVFTNNGAEC